MKLGVDLSMQEELNEYDPHYYYQGKEVDPYLFFGKQCHIDSLRLRLWHHPFDEEGNPYGGGSNDLERFLIQAKKGQQAGMKILLDFHFSDFFVDPSRQKLPKAWANATYDELATLLDDYVRKTLTRIKNEGIKLHAIQIGNETTSGFLHPFGNVNNPHIPNKGGGFAGFARFFKIAHRACKDIYPEALTLVHLEHPGSYGLQEWWLDNVLKEGIDFDVIGESYYPYWHGNLKEFEASILKLEEKYHKPIWIVEMGYEWAVSKLEGHHSDFPTDTEEFLEGNIDGRVPFHLSKQGQADYLKHFLALCKRIGIERVYYWEPTWIELPNQGWAKPAGMAYCGLEPGPAGNDWANETLFDYEGHANPAVEIFNQDFADKL